MPYLSASAVVIHYEEALYQVYGPLPLYTNKPKLVVSGAIFTNVDSYDKMWYEKSLKRGKGE